MIIYFPLLFLSTPVSGFVASSFPGFSCSFFANQQACPTRTFSAVRFNPLRLGSVPGQGTQEVNDAPLLALNGSLIDATALAESKTAVGAYQITRPRWYNRAEAAVIVLLVQELRLLDVRGVEHMLEATDAFRNQDAGKVRQRARFLMKVAPGANFRTVIQRHPRTLLVPVQKMKHVCGIISAAYPDADMARVVERIPSVFSRNATKLERNIAGLKNYAPEVNSAIFQTVQKKVAALRFYLPGLNLRAFLKGMPTALARSQETVPRGLNQLRQRFPTASSKELVRIVESAPSLVRMSGVNGTLDIKVDALMTLLPGVNVTNIIANAPGVLIRSIGSLPAKVEKLVELFPSANITKMVSRTPGILYLDIDRTVKPKALWIKQAVGLEQEELDRLIEQGPWLLKAGWGPLARLEFAIDSGIARKDRPAGLVGLVRRSRVAFAAAHHPLYANFLRRRLEDECVDGEMGGGEVEEALHPRAWGGGAGRGVEQSSPGSRTRAGSAINAGGRIGRLKNAGATEGVVLDLKEEEEEAQSEQHLIERTAVEVGELEDALGRERKSRMGGVKDRPPRFGESRRPENGDELLDLGRGAIVRRDRIGP